MSRTASGPQPVPRSGNAVKWRNGTSNVRRVHPGKHVLFLDKHYGADLRSESAHPTVWRFPAQLCGAVLPDSSRPAASSLSVDLGALARGAQPVARVAARLAGISPPSSV